MCGGLVVNSQRIAVVEGVIPHQRVTGGAFVHRTVEDQPFRARAGVHGKKSGFVHQHPAANPNRIKNAATVGLVCRRTLEGHELIKSKPVNHDPAAWLVGINVNITARAVQRQILRGVGVNNYVHITRLDWRVIIFAARSEYKGNQ